MTISSTLLDDYFEGGCVLASLLQTTSSLELSFADSAIVTLSMRFSKICRSDICQIVDLEP